MNQFDITESRSLRDNLIRRVEVLNKVKQLFLVPGVEMMTGKQVADYYEVDYPTIRSIYKAHREEIDMDGVHKKKQSDVVLGIQTPLVTPVKKGVKIVTLSNGQQVSLNPGLTNFFSVRAVLRIGMLLRDSEVAKEVRTQLLNVFDHATDEQKTADIDEEDKILLRIIHSADDVERAMALSSYKAFTQRHVDKLQGKVNELETTLSYMCDGAKRWGNRQIANALIYAISRKERQNPSHIWHDLYHQMQYALGIVVTARKPKPGDMSYIARIRTEEWPDVHKLIGAMAVECGVNVPEIINNMNAQFAGYHR